MGEYKESLSSGGDLIVDENSWRIKYYFPGPDLRYNGRFFTIRAENIDTYIVAWKNNFEKYQQIKTSMTLSGTYETIGEAGMKISVGGYRDGVCIDGWHMCINKQEKIDQIIADYEQCKIKAKTIQKLLKTLK